jgi:hypothetical protein
MQAIGDSVKNWLVPGAIRLKGYRIRSLELRENRFSLFLENRHGTKEVLVLHGLIAFRDRGAIGKSLGPMRLEDAGSHKRLTIPGLRRGTTLLACECMEARFDYR